MDSVLRQELQARRKGDVSFYAELHEKARRNRKVGNIAGRVLLVSSPVVAVSQEPTLSSAVMGVVVASAGAACLKASKRQGEQAQHCSQRLAAEQTQLDALTGDDKPENRFSGLGSTVGDTAPSVADLDE